MRDDDLSLALACAERRPGAWETLLPRVTPSLKAAAARLLARQGLPSGGSEVEDLVQGVLAELLERDGAALKAYSGRASLETYLSVILAHRILRMEALRPVDPSREAPDPAPGPLSVLERKESAGRLRAALGELPARDRLALSLQLEGASQGEIAGILGIPSPHAGVLLTRARERLRGNLEKTGEIL